MGFVYKVLHNQYGGKKTNLVSLGLLGGKNQVLNLCWETLLIESLEGFPDAKFRGSDTWESLKLS